MLTSWNSIFNEIPRIHHACIHTYMSVYVRMFICTYVCILLAKRFLCVFKITSPVQPLLSQGLGQGQRQVDLEVLWLRGLLLWDYLLSFRASHIFLSHAGNAGKKGRSKNCTVVGLSAELQGADGETNAPRQVHLLPAQIHPS